MITGKEVGFATYEAVYPAAPKYSVVGADSQVVEIQLQPGESIKAEPGVMMHMHPETEMKMEMQPMCGCKSICAGESCCKVNYTNKGGAPQYIGLTPNFPAKVVPMILRNGESVRSKEGGYMAEIGNVDVSVAFDCSPLRACFSGQGCILQSLTGGEGDLNVVFLAAGGTVLEKNLGADESIVVDTGSLVAWDSTVTMGLQPAGGCLGCMFGGEGFYNTKMTGPGRLIIQSMSFPKFVRALVPPGSAAGNAASMAGDIAGAAAGAPEDQEEMTR